MFLSGLLGDLSLSADGIDILSGGPAGWSGFDSFFFLDFGNAMSDQLFFEAAHDIMSGSDAIGDKLHALEALSGQEVGKNIGPDGTQITAYSPDTFSQYDWYSSGVGTWDTMTRFLDLPQPPALPQDDGVFVWA